MRKLACAFVIHVFTEEVVYLSYNQTSVTYILLSVCQETMIHMQLNAEAGSMSHCPIKTAFSWDLHVI